MSHPSHAPYCDCPQCKPPPKPEEKPKLPPKCSNCWWAKAMDLKKCNRCDRPVGD